MSKRVLVIDDDNAVRETICDNLRASGFEILEAANGLHGMAMIEGYGIPDVIITDIMMPEMDGLEVVREVRKQNPAAKIIAISGGSTTGLENPLDNAHKEGASAVFSKPLDLDALEEAINRLAV